MKNNKLKFNTILLVLIVILLAVICYLLLKNNTQVVNENNNDILSEQIDKDITSQQKDENISTKTENKKTEEGASFVLKNIFSQYKNGIIEECFIDGKIYYSASLNAYDGGGEVFDSNGKVVGQYIGFTGKYTGIVPENCTKVYTVSPNIWNYPPINKYDLK